MKRYIQFTLLFFVGTLLGFNEASAQRFELGAWGGISHYFGDLNTNTSFAYARPAAGIFVRNNIGHRASFKHGVSFGSVAFEDAASKDEHKIQRNLSFKSNLLELSSQFEFNFLEYIHGHNRKWFSPYIFTGFSIFYFNPRAKFEGEWYDLQQLGTEGQNDPSYSGNEKYKLISYAIPIGGGIKMSIGRAWTIGFEAGVRKTFTDYLDDVSKTYISPLSLPGGEGGLSESLSDRSEDQIGVPGYQRGTSTKKDDFLFAGFQISFAFISVRCPDPKAL